MAKKKFCISWLKPRINFFQLSHLLLSMERHPHFVQIPLIFQESNTTLPWNPFPPSCPTSPITERVVYFTCPTTNIPYDIAILSLCLFLCISYLYVSKMSKQRCVFHLCKLSFPQGLHILAGLNINSYSNALKVP